MSIQINLFGPLADLIGATQLNMKDIADTKTLKRKMLDDFPKLADHQFMIAVSKQIVNENVNLKSGDVVALLPPFAGG